MNKSLKSQLFELEKKHEELVTWLQNPGNVPVEAILDKRIELQEIKNDINKIEHELLLTD
jgi:hypothetical protein